MKKQIVFFFLALLGLSAVSTAQPPIRFHAIGCRSTLMVWEPPQGQSWDGYWKALARKTNSSAEISPGILVHDAPTKKWLLQILAAGPKEYSTAETFITSNKTENRVEIDTRKTEQLPDSRRIRYVSGYVSSSCPGISVSKFDIRVKSYISFQTVDEQGQPKGTNIVGRGYELPPAVFPVRDGDILVSPVRAEDEGFVLYMIVTQYRYIH